MGSRASDEALSPRCGTDKKVYASSSNTSTLPQRLSHRLKVHAPPDSLAARVVDDFESYEDGAPPSRWKFITSGKEVWPLTRVLDDREKFYVVEEEGNQFARAYTRGEALRVSLRNGEEFDWNLQRRPRLQWRWRAHQLPEGASEKGKNDTGGALYVTFGTDWLGRPKSIKYSYSSSLPVGTVVDYGNLYVIVVDSASEIW